MATALTVLIVLTVVFIFISLQIVASVIPLHWASTTGLNNSYMLRVFTTKVNSF